MTIAFEVISQGEELVSGQTVDTNAAWLCAELGAIGLVPARISVVGDDVRAIQDLLVESAGRARVVVCTGGLGPTSDDLTRDAAAAAFGMPLFESGDAMAQIEARYRARNRDMPVKNRVQALLPTGAALLENRLGTAPGFRIDREDCTLFFLPGVPYEMKEMAHTHVFSHLRSRFSLPPRRTVYFRCAGLAESIAAERMDGVERPGVGVGYRASFPEVQVKLHLDADVDAEPLIADTLNRLGDYVFGVDSGPLAQVVGELLAERGETVATAESCTAGRVTAALTEIPGASRYVVGGAVVYSNAEKERQCGVRRETLDTYGAVSEATARELAEGIRARTGATWGLAITGIAGPDGGSADKPVGTVHLACAGPDGTLHRHVRLPYDRTRNLQASTMAVLDLLRRRLRGIA